MEENFDDDYYEEDEEEPGTPIEVLGVKNKKGERKYHIKFKLSNGSTYDQWIKHEDLEYGTVSIVKKYEKEMLEKENREKEEKKKAIELKQLSKASKIVEPAKVVFAPDFSFIYEPVDQIITEEKEEIALKPVQSLPSRRPDKSRVPTLRSLCIRCVGDNLLLYEGFEYVPLMIKSQLFVYLAKKQQLTSHHLQQLVDEEQKTIDLSSIWHVIVDEHLWAIGEKCSKLITLNLSGSIGIKDYGLVRLFQGCPRITHLNLKQCTDLTTDSAIAIGKFLPNLKVLNLSECKKIGTHGIINMIGSLKNIEDLDISWISNIDPIALFHILQQSQYLQNLNAENAFKWKGKEKSLIFDKILNMKKPVASTTLRSLNLNGISWSLMHNIALFDRILPLVHQTCLEILCVGTENDIPTWSRLGSFSHFSTNLKTLELHRNFNSGSYLLNGSSWTALQNLVIDRVSNLNLSAIKSTLLQSLYIESKVFNARDIGPMIKSNTNLQSLTLKQVPGISFKSVMFAFRYCTQLTSIYFDNIGEEKDVPKADEADFAYVEWPKVQLPLHRNLKTLVLMNCKWFRGDLLPCLSKQIPNLTTFECDNCPFITDANLLEFLHGTPKLLKLRLYQLENIISFGERYESETLDSLELGYVNLPTETVARLAVSCPKLTSLSLQKTWQTGDNVLDTIVSTYQNLTRLSILCFSIFKFEDFQVIKMMKGLDTLKLSLCSIACTGLNYSNRSYLPIGCSVEFGGCDHRLT